MTTDKSDTYPFPGHDESDCDGLCPLHALAAYTEHTHQVWVRTPNGGLHAYRTDLIYSVAKAWAAQWNISLPAGIEAGSTFLAVKATTTYQEI